MDVVGAGGGARAAVVEQRDHVRLRLARVVLVAEPLLARGRQGEAGVLAAQFPDDLPGGPVDFEYGRDVAAGDQQVSVRAERD